MIINHRSPSRLNAAELNTVKPPKDKPRITLRIRLPDRTATAEIAAKSLRKAQRAIREAGADNIALVLQGRFIAGDRAAKTGRRPSRRHDQKPPRSIMGRLRSVWRSRRLLHTRAEDL
jgi:hypothetical protein